MISAVRGAVCVAVVCLLGCGAPSNGTIAGKVTLTNGGEAGGLRVTLLGPVSKRVDPTPASGAYSFDKLPAGVYLISVEATDTKEGRLSYGVESDGATAVNVPDLSFSPVGSLTGKVNNAAGPVAGATVYLSGSDRVSITDAAGGYGFADVPAGDYSLVARSSGPVAQIATAMVKIVRGKQEAMPLVLGNDLTETGKINGTLALFNGGSPKDIKVSVADISVMTDDNGKFSLTLPPGEYEPIAELAGYPKQTLGFATVRTGQTTTLPVKTLSQYKAIPWGSRISSATWTATSETDIATLQVSVTTDYSTESYFVDTKTFERKLFALGFIYGHYLSKNGKWIAFVPNSGRGVVAVNSATGQTHSFASPSVQSGPVISDDESTMMFYSGAPQNSLVRVDLNTGVATNLPAFSNSYFQTNERFLARSADTAPFDVQLITPTSATTVFNNMDVLTGALSVTLSNNTFGSSVAYAYSGCPATCSLRILSPTAATSSPVTAAFTSTPFVISGSVREWVGLNWGGITPGRTLVKVADGTTTALPATTTSLLFNETMSRVVTYSTTPGFTYEVREDVVPPNATSPVHFAAPGFPNGAWLSPTRFIVFGNGTTKRADIKAGVVTTDNDVTYDTGQPQSPVLFAPGAIWIKASTMKRMATVYDSPDLSPDTLGITGSFNFTGIGSKSGLVNPLLGKFAGFSDGVSIFALDGVKNEVRKIGVGTLSSNGLPFVPTDRMKVVRLGGVELQFFESGRLLSLSEPGLIISASGAAIATTPKGVTLAAAILGAEPKDMLFLTAIP